MLAAWVDEPMPLVSCKAHVLEPFDDDVATHRCVHCGQLATDKEETDG